VNIYNGSSSSTSGIGSNHNSGGLAPAHYYIRPIQPFLTHYEEDTTFLACAPMATPFQDPPLHFVREPISGNVSWCAESYPTQNDNLQWIDPPAPVVAPSPVPTYGSGYVSNYTSHTEKNTSSAACAASIPTIPNITGVYTYPPSTVPNAYGLHSSSTTWDSATASLTCDRTVVADNASQTTPSTQWARFPLLAPSSDLEDATYGIQTDSSYHCLITYDNNGGKTGTASPTDGCCNKNSVFVKTGSSSGTPSAAHLEPSVPCSVPAY
jgi:hypothetical protein